jgi:hypothetical protein
MYVNDLRLGIDGIVEILQVHFATTSDIFRIRGLRKHHEIRRYKLGGFKLKLYTPPTDPFSEGTSA